MSTTPRKTARSLSGASSGERTVRGRRSSSNSHGSQSSPTRGARGLQVVDDPLHEPRTISDDESANNADTTTPTAASTEEQEQQQDQEMITFTSHPAWDDKDDDRLPPLWRQMSDQPFVEGEDLDEGPSDYWRRPGSEAERWGDNDADDHHGGGDGEEEMEQDGDADAAEYEKRLEQVLALQPETPSPTKRRGFRMQQFDDDDTESWSDYHPINGRGYDEAVRDVLGEGTEKGDDELGGGAQSDHTPPSTVMSASVSGLERQVQSPGPSRSYIHPSVSRLRSQHPRQTSTSTVQSTLTTPHRITSHFSQLSLARSDSLSTLSGVNLQQQQPVPHPLKLEETLEMEVGPAFTFHALRHLSAHAFNRRTDPERRSASGPPTPNTDYGTPTVMDVHGMIAVGTDRGWVIVYTFAQEVRCILGNDNTVQSGPVTAVTVCPDQTFIGVGHANGNVYLYDLKMPAKPARTQLALTLRQVQSGRKEGHIQGSRILHIGFVGKRHTSIVTGDEDGRAFWFSLGRVMGVDSNDAVRMLGSYPDKPPPVTEDPRSPPPDGTTSAPSSIMSHPSKRPTTLFATLPLPLGAAPHATDQFHFSALLTPVKLVVVGMKPNAKTWFRKMRGDAGGEFGGFVGCAAWLRSGEVTPAKADKPASDPVLAYAWGTSLRFLRVKVAITPPKDKKSEATKTPEFVEGRRWEAPHAIQSLHWFDSDHMLLVTSHQVLLLNVRSMKAVENTPLQTKLLTSQDFYSGLSVRKSGLESVPPVIQSSCRTHRDKLFLLTRANVQVGTLQHWNDKVLANVHKGDFLAAINLALAYYEGRARGNTINLPDQPDARREVVGTRVRELMRASLEWAFSEERMHDDTHFSADGRGVDLTSLFEGLATACIDACLAMHDLDFLFNDAFEHFSNAGIQNIFLTRLEGYIFDGRVDEMPPNVVQALIRMHDERGEYALAESVIWHVDPASLDINQAVTLCEKHSLFDALIHVYTRAMADYIAPIVRLIRIVCDVQRHRQSTHFVGDDFDDDERLAPDAYKLYAYVAHVLSGLWYPSGEAMSEGTATVARNAVYEMLFSDHNVYWPEGSHDLVNTDREEPYPYLRLLLRFDTEAFLHAMDIAFEDPYLNDPGRAINRQSIINLMLDVMDDDFYSSDVTFLHIFVARNLPKYPQFVFIPPSTSHRILVSLAADPDQSTREDRQLAAEYLLSAYTPHDADEMLARFETAGFFRILRAAYRRDRKWGLLVATLLKDPDADSGVFASLDEVIAESTVNGFVPPEVSRTVSDALPQLFELSVTQTARLLDHSLPTLHDTAIAALDGAEVKQTAYLRCLLDPEVETDGDDVQPSSHIHIPARHKYISLLAKHDASAVVPFLDARGADYFDLPRLAEQAEEAHLPEAQLWALDRAGRRADAFETVDAVLASQGADLAAGILARSEGDVHVHLATLTGVMHMAIRLCREHSGEGKPIDTAEVEDMWFGVLHSITELVHSISALETGAEGGVDAEGPSNALGTSSLEALRTLVQDTLQALLASPSKVSFARLFKRLVEAAPKSEEPEDADAEDEHDAQPNGTPKKKKRKNRKAHKKSPSSSSHKTTGRAYSEFRTILTGMLDSFRADADLLALSIRLIEADGFDLLEDKVALAARGWRPASGLCVACGRKWDEGKVKADGEALCSACVRVGEGQVEVVAATEVVEV